MIIHRFAEPAAARPLMICRRRPTSRAPRVAAPRWPPTTLDPGHHGADGLAIGPTPHHNQAGKVSQLRTSYGPRRRNSAHLNGQPWSPTTCHLRSATAARSRGQGVADSNLASPTTRWRIVTPDQTRVHPVTGPSSTSLSARELGPDWAHQREYATPRRGRCSLRLGSGLMSLIR